MAGDQRPDAYATGWVRDGCVRDFAYASETARLHLTEWTARHHCGRRRAQNHASAVGERRAKEVILTVRPFSRGARPLEWGLLNRVCAPELRDEAIETGRRIADNAPIQTSRTGQDANPSRVQRICRAHAVRDRSLYNRMVPTRIAARGALLSTKSAKPQFKGGAVVEEMAELAIDRRFGGG